MTRAHRLAPSGDERSVLVSDAGRIFIREGDFVEVVPVEAVGALGCQPGLHIRA